MSIDAAPRNTPFVAFHRSAIRSSITFGSIVVSAMILTPHAYAILCGSPCMLETSAYNQGFSPLGVFADLELDSSTCFSKTIGSEPFDWNTSGSKYLAQLLFACEISPKVLYLYGWHRQPEVLFVMVVPPHKRCSHR